MAFVNASLLLAGGLFVAVPILVHLAMRQKPKHQVFPALRFVQRRQINNRRRMRLKHALLLLLRVLIVLLAALALARPSVASAQLSNWIIIGGLALLLLLVGWLLWAAVSASRGWAMVAFLGLVALGLVAGIVNSAWALSRDTAPVVLGDRRAPVAAVLVFDTSPRMAYRFENQTRIEHAQELAQWLLRQLPEDSDVAVVDSKSTAASFAVDRGAAAATIDALEITFRPDPWGLVLERAVNLLESSDRTRKEIYLFSDLTQRSWSQVDAAALNRRLQSMLEVTVQTIDVGIDQPRNVAIREVQLSQESLTPGSPFEVRVAVGQDGPPTDVNVRLMMEPPNAPDPIVIDGQPQLPEATVRGRQQVRAEQEQTSWARFPVNSLAHGTHHGFVEIEADALAVDNRMALTVHVRSPWPVLVVAGANAETFYLTECLAPAEFRKSNRAKFECRVITPDELSRQKLTDYAAVALLDPPPLEDRTWRQLRRYVEGGGGLAVFVGRNAKSAAAFNSAAAAELLPGLLERRWRDRDGVALMPRDYEHPVFRVLRDIRATVPWEAMPVFEHWVLKDLNESTQVVAPFRNNQPAIVERPIEKGRVVLMTTPITDADRPDRAPWNLLPTAEQSWPFMIMIDRMFLHLVNSRDAKLNYQVGQSARLPVNAQPGERFSLFTPQATWQELTSVQGEVVVPFTTTPGVYRLRTDDDVLPRGFSVTLPPDATRLERIREERLAEILGPRSQVARTRDQIVREIDTSRVGREFYPFLIPLLVIVMALEYITANRFYPVTES